MIVVNATVAASMTPAQANAPIIGSHNVVSIANLTATSSLTNYPVSNLANPSTALIWGGTTTAAQDLVVASPGVVDYVAFARHNLATVAAVVTCYGDTGSGYVSLGSITPIDNTPILFQIPSANYTNIKVNIATGAVVPWIGVLYVGQLLRSPRNLYVGHTPMNLNRQTKVANGRSESGNFLGRIVIGEVNSTTVDIDNLDPAWYRSTFDPFVVRAKETPFFFGWRPFSYPADITYAWLTGDVSPSNQRSNGMMQASMSLMGVTS